MEFKKWFDLQEVRYKGLWRKFRQDNPGMPVQAAKDVYNNRPSHLMRRTLQGIAFATNPTTTFVQPNTPNGTTTDYKPSPGVTSITVKDSGNLPTQILSGHNFSEYEWTPKPVVVQITPNDFNRHTLEVMLARRFGFITDNQVRDDANRMKLQRALAQERGGGGNEPVIMVKGDDGKYELIEGWHRTMNYLVYVHDPNYGAPNDQIELLKNVRVPVTQIDLSKWRPVPIKAWVGTKKRSAPEQ